MGNGRDGSGGYCMLYVTELKDSERGQVAGLEWNGMHEVEGANCPSCTRSRVLGVMHYKSCTTHLMVYAP